MKHADILFAILLLLIGFMVVMWKIAQPEPKQVKPHPVYNCDSVMRPFVTEDMPDSIQWKTEPN